MTDINRRMIAWRQATDHPERTSEFLRSYPLRKFENRSDVAKERANDMAYYQRDMFDKKGNLDPHRVSTEEFANLMGESGARNQDEFYEYLAERGFRDLDPVTAIKAYRNMLAARDYDEESDFFTGLEYSAPRGGDFNYTGASTQSNFGHEGKKYLLMNRPGSRTQRRKFVTDPLDSAKKGAKAAYKAGAVGARDMLDRIEDTKSHDEPIDHEKRRAQNKDGTRKLTSTFQPGFYEDL